MTIVTSVQIDVVDGHFATPPSWPYTDPPMLDVVRPTSDVGRTTSNSEPLLPYIGRFRFDIDLMVVDPERAAGRWLDAGASRLTLHAESVPDMTQTLRRMKAHYGHEVGHTGAFELGVAINVATDTAIIESVLGMVDYVQFMGIATIGRQGEPFDMRVLAKIRAFHSAHPNIPIQVDGGVTLATAPEVLAAGASRLVVGHALVGAPEPARVLDAFAELVSHATRPAHARSARYAGTTSLTDADVRALEEKAREIRQTVIEMLVVAESGHTAGPLGMADIFTAFYFHILTHDPKNSEWALRDRLVLSNGHITPVRYAAMAHAGYFPIEECLTLRKLGSRLQGHPERLRLPGLETTSGPLGSGLSQGAGMAYALRMDAPQDVVRPTSDVGRTTSNIGPRVYCLMSDGEQQEGNTWEAAMFAGKYKLHNLTAVMDRNNIQIDGVTEDVMPLEPLADKYRAFGWHVLEVGGHDMRALIAAVEEARAIVEKPTLIIAHTIPGKGVPEIEGDYRWHGKPPSKEEGARFLAQLQHD